MTQGIDADKVTRWMQAQVPTLVPPVEFELISGGRSNLTYRCVDRTGGAYVLRRPPLGHVLESAHDMGREHRIISALAPTRVPVAPTFGLCLDAEVNGAPFYLMQFVDGAVLHDANVSAGMTLNERASLGEHAIEVLATLHAIDPEDVGLGDLGRKESYIARQLNRWTKQWQATKTHEIPEMEETCRLLAERIPEQVGATIVHGDYRPGNWIVGGGRIRAVLDWELCTLGDPLADVGYLLNSWIETGEASTVQGDQSPTALPGFPTRAELVRRYTERTGRDLSHIDYYRAFSHWRLAAIAQGVYKRYLVGAMGTRSDMNLEGYKQGVQRRAEAALSLMDR